MSDWPMSTNLSPVAGCTSEQKTGFDSRMGHQFMKTRKKQKYWYEITFLECVLCEAGSIKRVRRYGKKPPSHKRHHSIPFACDHHFL